MKTYTAEDFKAWGAQGGAKSKRVLTAAQAKAMVAAREKKRRKTKRVTRRANALSTAVARPPSQQRMVRGLGRK
jgi:hypothetical protein